MTTAELHKILDDEYKKISLEEYQNVLYQLKNDTIACATQEEFELQKQTPKYHWYYGETNAFEIALALSEHINPNQTAIECLKEIKEDISLMTDLSMIKETEHKTAILSFYKDIMQVINAIIDNKIKELEGKEK